MLIYRLDAFHPAGDGVFCCFTKGLIHRDHPWLRRLRIGGWELDFYIEDIPSLESAQFLYLCDGFWPLLPTSTILSWYPAYQSPPIDGEDIFEPKPGGKPCEG